MSPIWIRIDNGRQEHAVLVFLDLGNLEFFRKPWFYRKLKAFLATWGFLENVWKAYRIILDDKVKPKHVFWLPVYKTGGFDEIRSLRIWPRVYKHETKSSGGFCIFKHTLRYARLFKQGTEFPHQWHSHSQPLKCMFWCYFTNILVDYILLFTNM